MVRDFIWILALCVGAVLIGMGAYYVAQGVGVLP